MQHAFTLRLKPSAVARYRELHEEVWPELEREIRESGIAKIAIFADGPVLFVYSEISDPDAWQRLFASEVHDRWAAVIEPLLETDPDGGVATTGLEPVYRLG